MRHESRDEAAGAAEPVRSAGASEQRAGEEQAGGEQSDADTHGRGKTPPRLSTWNSSDYQLPTNQPNFPMLALIVSGGHSQLVFFRDHFDYTLLGQTHDDAIGEAFDKVAKIIGLPYPGGPSVGRKATEGNAHAYQFPKAKLTHVSDALLALRQQHAEEYGQDMPSHSYDFSFSGIKTAVLRAAQEAIGEDHTFPSKNLPQRLSEAQKADIAASFDRIATETVVDKTLLAYKEFQTGQCRYSRRRCRQPELRRQLAERLPCPIAYTDPRLCTDNGAMIATLGCFHMKRAHPTADPYTLDIQPNLSM
jgi:N6-L-threonylcarbamoyladenine synthase